MSVRHDFAQGHRGTCVLFEGPGPDVGVVRFRFPLTFHVSKLPDRRTNQKGNCTKQRGRGPNKERKEKRQALSVLWGCHIPSRGCRELCLRVCREGLQVENDNHPGSMANLSALSCVCVSCKTAEGLPAEKGLDAGLKSSSREGW